MCFGGLTLWQTKKPIGGPSWAEVSYSRMELKFDVTSPSRSKFMISSQRIHLLCSAPVYYEYSSSPGTAKKSLQNCIRSQNPRYFVSLPHYYLFKEFLTLHYSIDIEDPVNRRSSKEPGKSYRCADKETPSFTLSKYRSAPLLNR